MFVEWETGSNPIVSVDKDRKTATKAKLQRYNSFFGQYANFDSRRTWYMEAFPDNWVAREHSVEWSKVNEHARRVGYEIGQSCLALLGMPRARVRR